MIKKYLPDLLLLSIAVVWGASYSLTKGALDYTPVLLFLVIRFGITFLLLLPFTLKDLISSSKKSILYGSLLGLILSSIFLAETYGVKYTTATNAAILISLSIVFTPFVDSFRTKSFPSMNLIFAALLSIIGVYILTNKQEVEFNVGDVLILTAAVLRAVMLTSTKIYTTKFKINSLVLTQIQMGVIFIVSFLLLTQTNLDISLPLEFGFWWRLLFIVVFCTILAFFAQNYGVKHSTPNKASFYMGTEPLFGVVFALILLSETISMNVVIGGLLIFIATFIGIKEENKLS
jgi:drug/metabolite transporter (DMT)-like permease